MRHIIALEDMRNLNTDYRKSIENWRLYNGSWSERWSSEEGKRLFMYTTTRVVTRM